MLEPDKQQSGEETQPGVEDRRRFLGRGLSYAAASLAAFSFSGCAPTTSERLESIRIHPNGVLSFEVANENDVATTLELIRNGYPEQIIATCRFREGNPAKDFILVIQDFQFNENSRSTQTQNSRDLLHLESPKVYSYLGERFVEDLAEWRGQNPHLKIQSVVANNFVLVGYGSNKATTSFTVVVKEDVTKKEVKTTESTRSEDNLSEGE